MNPANLSGFLKLGVLPNCPNMAGFKFPSKNRSNWLDSPKIWSLFWLHLFLCWLTRGFCEFLSFSARALRAREPFSPKGPKLKGIESRVGFLKRCHCCNWRVWFFASTVIKKPTVLLCPKTWEKRKPRRTVDTGGCGLVVDSCRAEEREGLC